MHRLGSFSDLMRISSTATNCIQGVCFCSAVFDKLDREIGPVLTSWGEKITTEDQFLLFQIVVNDPKLFPKFALIMGIVFQMLLMHPSGNYNRTSVWYQMNKEHSD